MAVNKVIFYNIAFLLLIFLNACNAETSESNATLNKAKQLTIEYNLSDIAIECLTFEVQEVLFKGKRIIDAREVHNAECGGDPETSTRVFSIAIHAETGEAWSDAKSVVGQLEILEPKQ